MIGFGVYSATVDPSRLYSTGDLAAIDEDTTTELAWAEDRPLDLVVDLSERRLWWAFEADHETKARRTGHFVAAYHGGLDMFRGFAEELRALDETDGWAVPQTESSDQRLGFDLWRLSTSVDDDARFERLVTSLTDSTQHVTAPIQFGMQSRERAFEVVKALDDRAVECTVAVGTAGAREVSPEIDLLLVPGGSQDFDSQPVADSQTTPETTSTTRATSGTEQQRDHSPSINEFGVRISGIVLVALIGFSAYSFVVPQPVQPISGLSVFGSLLGVFGATVFWYSGVATRRSLTAWVKAHERRLLPLYTAGAFAGFIYPRLVWDAGVFLGRGGYLFGPLQTLSGAFPATIFYVTLLFSAAVGVISVRQQNSRRQVPTRSELNRIATAFAIYGLALFLATGLSQGLWFRAIPAA